jgi:hypothetical protein
MVEVNKTARFPSDFIRLDRPRLRRTDDLRCDRLQRRASTVAAPSTRDS